MKSIIIFGKGPSVLRCTRKLVDEHDEIAICNYPVLNDFFYSLIKNRTINYHFANCGTFDQRYTNEINNKLNIQQIFNTNTGVNHYKKYLNNNARFQNKNLYQTFYKNYFNKIYKCKPTTGIYAIQYIINTKLYDKITIVGLDGIKKGEKMYYYNIKDISLPLKYLTRIGIYDKKGTILISNPEHPFEKTFQYINDCFNKYKNIQFKMITTMIFDKKYDNLTLL